MPANPQLHIVASPEAPHAVAAERALLGALLYNNDLWDELDGKLALEHFYDKRHQTIFAAAQKLLADGRADVVLLAQALRDAGKLGDAGGEEYVRQIESISAAENNVSGYAAEICKTAMLRRMHSVLQSANARVMHPDGSSPQEILDDTEARLGELAAEDDAGGRKLTSVADESRKLFDNLAEIINSKDFDRLQGLQTGYPRLDKMTTGLQGGDLVIIAARPGGGKTAFALNIIRHVSAEGAGVVVFSLEMSDRHLVARLVSQDRVEMQKLRTAKDYRGNPMSSRDLRVFSEAVDRLQNREVYIDDSGALNILELKSRARRLARQLARKEKGRLSLVVVDYLQLLTAPNSRNRDANRAQEVADIARGLKALAKELDVPVVALSQLNRSAKERATKEPLLSDLRESGAIEQDADIVLFLHEEQSAAEEDYASPPPEGTPVKLIVGKQRNGPVGRIDLQFHKHFSRFAEAARDGDSGPGRGGF